ncbi:type III-A CRISPR-associated RAMP protein Csm4 [Thermotoga sp. SG1]|uniref:type III-A CRISPR-associated RAMP protein Csm4 n=1 Tax=Thermotoga sp. SG1 TaxID=126739 RepID=UPI000C77F8C2|nr:type III-A CRISPR-associated RAMP protein Csm4 [Thermotoga sp. SG1]
MNFRGGFRVGRGDESDSTLPTIHSDTIYGAIVYHAFKHSDKAEDFAKNLKVSSLIFLKKSDKKERLLVPKPLSYNVLDPEDEDSKKGDFKKLKKANYVFLDSLKDYTSIEKAMESVCEESPVEVSRIPRNTLDRVTNSSNLYFVEVAFVKESFTPVVLAEFPDEYEELFKASVRSLGDSGLGGDSTYGYGLFDADFEEAPFLSEEGKYYLSLSLFIPSVEERRRLNEGFYKVVRRRGVKKDVMKVKKELHYIQEGSVFPFKPVGRGVLKIEDYFVQTSPLCVAFGGDAS